MVLKGKELCFRYSDKSRLILDHYSVEIKEGERVGLSAPSGSGKSTLAKLLAGYEVPDSGLVALDSSPLSSYRGYCPVQLIWQHPELVVNPRLTMAEILKEAGSADPAVLASLNIESKWLTRYPGELSGGELQRFCIARALGPATRFLLADEITTMLDLITQAQIWQIILKIAKDRNLGLLIVSHSESLLKQLCTRQIHL